MKTSLTEKDRAFLVTAGIAPESHLLFGAREADELIRQLRMDLAASEAELRAYRQQALTGEGLIQAYQRLDEECATMHRAAERNGKAANAERRKRKCWQASTLCLAGGAIAWWIVLRGFGV